MSASSLLLSCPGQIPVCFPILLLAFSSSDPMLYLHLFLKGPGDHLAYNTKASEAFRGIPVQRRLTLTSV